MEVHVVVGCDVTKKKKKKLVVVVPIATIGFQSAFQFDMSTFEWW